MQKADPFVVLCWENIPGHIPPFHISPRQLTIGVHQPYIFNVNPGSEMPDIMMPAGEYDLRDTLRQAGIVENPDLIVVWTSALGVNLPTNLSAFRCPKLLFCGDTHHMQHPIRHMIDYARAENFDAVATTCDRHHLHWFQASGFANCAWLPGISVAHATLPPWQTQRSDQVAFIGQTGTLHGWRGALLERIAATGTPVNRGLATRVQAAAEYASSVISFNGSLNGDLNMRVFEVLSAGGFLLTDRLSPQAGFELLLRPGQDCETYQDADELLDKIAFYRRLPAAALRIAQQGASTYQREHLPERVIAVLRDWMLDGRLPDRFNPRHDLRLATSLAAAGDLALRISVYERLQELQQLQPGSSVLVSPGWLAASAMDIADLVRLRLTVIGPAPELRAAAAAASMLDQLAFIDADAAAGQNWDIVLTASADAANEPWRSSAGRVMFADFEGETS